MGTANRKYRSCVDPAIRLLRFGGGTSEIRIPEPYSSGLIILYSNYLLSNWTLLSFISVSPVSSTVYVYVFVNEIKNKILIFKYVNAFHSYFIFKRNWSQITGRVFISKKKKPNVYAFRSEKNENARIDFSLGERWIYFWRRKYYEYVISERVWVFVVKCNYNVTV